jgi:hypothetical protein
MPWIKNTGSKYHSPPLRSDLSHPGFRGDLFDWVPLFVKRAVRCSLSPRMLSFVLSWRYASE